MPPPSILAVRKIASEIQGNVDMDPEKLYARYQELQSYVGWDSNDAELVRQAAPVLEPWFPALVRDFYDEIARHPDARKVITGGQEQIERLKGTLTGWLRELVSGEYDSAYVSRRWRVGWRHVEIGLDQVFTNVALSRLRSGLNRILHEHWPDSGATGEASSTRVLGERGYAVERGDSAALTATARAINKLLDLDLAIIEDAYQTEYKNRQQRSERLAAIGQVAAGVSHELRNPLNVVKTSIYYLLNARQPTAEKTAEHLQRIERHVMVADNVITALNSFAKMPLPQLAPLAVADAIQQALEINALPDTIQVAIDCPASLPKVMADGDQIGIVLGNLIRNAREAMPQGGRLAFTARLLADSVHVDVADTGSGIAPENLSRIMEPLFSTKARGLGLGLALARAILDKNNGSLSVTSTVGQGTTFTVALPCAPA
jgi:signal transduction histidine kinase